MSAVTERVAFPKVHIYKQDGWKIYIKCEGVYTEFVLGVAQAGEPKGFVILEGPGMRVSVGTGRYAWLAYFKYPVNLSKSGDIIYQLGEELRNKYNREPNWPFLRALGKRAFEPYDKYFS